MQQAVDAETDKQTPFLRLDVDIGGAHLRRVVEHGLQQLDYGASSRPTCSPAALKST